MHALTENSMLQIFIDGQLVDTILRTIAPEEGQTFESPAITEALGGREIANISFVGTMVMITTED